jgi:hypothetical protein
MAMKPTGANGLASLCIALLARKIASPAARTVEQSNTVRTGLFDTVKPPASRVLELEFQHLSNIRLQTLLLAACVQHVRAACTGDACAQSLGRFHIFPILCAYIRNLSYW